jgi:Flp pilus assembly protein TadB
VRHARQPVIITDAARSPAEELRFRQTRYVVMMVVRAGFLVLAAVLAMLRVPLLGVWVLICVVGAVVLPWLAVVLANNREPKPEHRLSRRFRGAARRAEPTQASLPQRVEPTVIDAEQ